MKVALAVIRVLPDRDANLAAILSMASEAADAGADLVVFPEAALTGLINNDDPIHDLPLGEPIPGPVTDVLGGLAQERCIWLAIGLLEREGGSLYDSAVLFRPDGEIGSVSVSLAATPATWLAVRATRCRRWRPRLHQRYQPVYRIRLRCQACGYRRGRPQRLMLPAEVVVGEIHRPR